MSSPAPPPSCSAQAPSDEAQAAVLAYRERWRSKHVSSRTRGGLHLAATLTGVGAGGLLPLLAVRDVAPVELLAVPATLVAANAAEYLLHRLVLHRRRPLLGFLERAHSGHHHRFFGAGLSACPSSRDWGAVLFPAPTILAFVLGMGGPLALLAALLVSTNVGLLVLATAVLGYGHYEVLHLLWHLPPGSRGAALVDRVAALGWLRAWHHRHHADASVAFNITWPVGDAVAAALGCATASPAPARPAKDSEAPRGGR